MATASAWTSGERSQFPALPQTLFMALGNSLHLNFQLPYGVNKTFPAGTGQGAGTQRGFMQGLARGFGGESLVLASDMLLP